jgi:hypothetical protein
MSSNVKTKTPVGFYHLSEIKVFLTEDNDKLASGDRCHRTGVYLFVLEFLVEILASTG